MKQSEQRSNIENILYEFTQLDLIHQKMITEVENIVYTIISDNIELLHSYPDLNQDVNSFSIDLINSTHSNIDKSQNYPAYRMKIELDSMDKLINRHPKSRYTNAFIKQLEHNIIAKIIDLFPEIMDLSADGFRLLDKDIKYQINMLYAILQYRGI